jgi:hypothetical protein
VNINVYIRIKIILMQRFFPKYFSNRSIYLYLGVLVLVNLIFISNSLPIVFLLFGLIEAIGFFYFSNILSLRWSNLTEKKFIEIVFLNAFILRLAWVLFSYVFFSYMTGQPFEFQAADARGYHGEAMWLANLIHKNQINVYFEYINGRYSDLGYAFYLGWQYWITGGVIIIARILKAFYGAYTCVLIYKVAKRNFGEEVGKLSAVFCVLIPNLIYYAGLHTKEVEMVFLTVWFVERADYLFQNKRYTVLNVSIPILLASSLFFFRTVLGATALFSLFSTVIFSSRRILAIGRRTLITVWLLLALGYFVGSKVATEVESVWKARMTNQEVSLEFRTHRTNGNAFAKYASSSIFVPLIFVLPLPTIVNTPNQENMQMLNGGNFVKNILSFFVLYSIYWIIKYKRWRDHVLIGSFTIGYLLVIAMSAFAQSERFHQPALPFLMIMAAFGVSKVTNTQKIYFSWYMVLLFIAIVGWSWYKLAGRGLV